MTMRQTLSIAAVCVGVTLTAAPAFAGPPGHPFERKPVPAGPAGPATDAGPQARTASCDCPMVMKGDTAMRDQCMAMMSDHREATPHGPPG
jgi:hypothetical protein